MSAPRFWYIRGLDAQTRLPESVTEDLKQRGRLERWGHRASITRRKEPAELYLILRGGVDVGDGVLASQVRLRPGDVFGETDYHEVEGALQAYDDTTLVALHRGLFEEIAEEHLGQFETSAGIVRKHQLAVPVAALLYTTPRRRLAKVLLHVTEQYGNIEGDEAALEIPLKSKHIASLSGLTSPRVRTLLDELQRERYVQVGRTELVIPSLARIRELSLT